MSFEVLLAMVFLVAWRGVQHGWERKGSWMLVYVCIWGMDYGYMSVGNGGFQQRCTA